MYQQKYFQIIKSKAMKKLFAFSFIFWSIFALFGPEALCRENGNNDTAGEAVETTPKYIPPIFGVHEILNLPNFDAPEEFIYEPLPGMTFSMPEEIAPDTVSATRSSDSMNSL